MFKEFIDGAIPDVMPIIIGVVVLFALIGIPISIAWWILHGAGSYGIIEGYVGSIGAGKTTLATQHALRNAISRNAVLLSNIPLFCGPRCSSRNVENSKCLVEHYVLSMTDDGLDLLELFGWAFKLLHSSRGLVLFLDEVGVIMPARLWKTFPVGLMWMLQQSRKLECEIIWTSQDSSFVDSHLRTLTPAVHYVKSFPPPSIWRRTKGKRPWFLYERVFSSKAGAQDKEKAVGTHMKKYKRIWESYFDTDAVVLPASKLPGAQALLDALSAAGGFAIMPVRVGSSQYAVTTLRPDDDGEGA